jgi:hypothetical protein
MDEGLAAYLKMSILADNNPRPARDCDRASDGQTAVRCYAKRKPLPGIMGSA